MLITDWLILRNIIQLRIEGSYKYVNMKKSPREKRCKIDESVLSCVSVYVCVITMDFIFWKESQNNVIITSLTLDMYVYCFYLETSIAII